MKQSKNVGSKAKKDGVIIYVQADGDKQCLNDQEVYLRAQCAEENLEVLCVLREVDISTIAEVIKAAFGQKDEVRFLVSVDVVLRTYRTRREIIEEGTRYAIGRSWRLRDIQSLSSFDPTKDVLALMDFVTMMREVSSVQ